MNFRNILKEIENTSPGAYNKVTGRRDVLKDLGSKVALAAIPFTIATLLPKRSSAKTTDTIVDSLNFILKLSYFQYNFFHIAVNTGGLIPVNPASNILGQNDLPGFMSIDTHSREHVVFLTAAINNLGGTPYTPPGYNSTDLNPYYVSTAYDFTSGGTYEVFSQYTSFLIVAQVFQDTIVRALQEQIPSLTSNTTVLTQIMQMLSVEGRNAAFVRTVRRYTSGGVENPAPWITNDISPLNDFKANYAGEDNLVQMGGISIDTLPDIYASTGVVPKESATAAFDEGLSSTWVDTFLGKFMA